MQTFYFTDPGKVRSHNEDSVTIINNDKAEFVLAIADGMIYIADCGNQRVRLIKDGTVSTYAGTGYEIDYNTNEYLGGYQDGAVKNAMILSVPEGDDKPLKYPLMFTISDLVIINKIDTLCVFDFDIEKAKERILKLNKNATIIPISAKTGEGIDKVAEWLLNQVNSWKK